MITCPDYNRCWSPISQDVLNQFDCLRTHVFSGSHRNSLINSLRIVVQVSPLTQMQTRFKDGPLSKREYKRK